MIIYVFKFFPLLKDNNKIKNCIQFLDSKFFNVIEDKEQALQQAVEESRRNNTVFGSGLALCLTIASIRPLLGTKEFELPFAVLLPFEITDRRTYIFIYIYMLLEAYYAAIACVIVDTLIWGLACHVTGHLRVLKHNLQHLEEEVNEKIPLSWNKLRNITNAEITYKKIIFCVQYHQAISSFVTQYEDCFSQTLFSELTGSVIIFGLCCLQLSKSDTLTTSAYMGNWYNYDIKSNQALILLMECSRKPMVVMAGKIFELSLDTFTTIIKRSYSVLALLQNYS